ncbi:MAG: hypothetical protein JWO30_4027 [Fibrobacteres bacterium]|nr:hypothetical protein [Fibrobacterota bacterium]
MVAKLTKKIGVALLFMASVFADEREDNISLANKYIVHAAEVIPLFNYKTKKKFAFPVKIISKYAVDNYTAGDSVVEVYYPELFIKGYVFKDSAVGFYAAGLDFQTNMRGKKEEFERLIPKGNVESQTVIGPEHDGEFFKTVDAKIAKLLNQCDEPDSTFHDTWFMGWETGAVGYVYYVHAKEPDQVGEIIYRKSDASSIHCSFKKSANEKEYSQILKRGIRMKSQTKK